MRKYSKEEKPTTTATTSKVSKEEKEQKLSEFDSYEKWLKSTSAEVQKGAKTQFDHIKETISNYPIRENANSQLEHMKQSFVTWRLGQAHNEEWYAERLSFWMKRYENFVGLTEVKASQALVVKEEKLFVDSQDRRRNTQTAINDVQGKLKSIRSELERTARGDDKYLALVTEEHSIIKEEFSLASQLENVERLEKEKFSRLGRAVRDSHEKERAQAEKTKYWSILGTIIGTCLGILGTTINNRRRMKELRQIVTDSTKIHAATIAAAAAIPLTTGNNENGETGSSITLNDITAVTSAAVEAASVAVKEASVSASKNAAAELVEPALETTQKHLENVSKQFLNHLQSLEKKMGQLNQSIKNQPEPVIKVASPNVNLTGDFKELQNVLLRQNTNMIESQNRIMNIRDQKFLNALKSTNSDSYNTFTSRVCDIEEKVKDIRSLLLAQAIQSSDSVISSSVKIHEAAKEAAKAVERSHEDVHEMVSDVESSLKLHEEQLRGQLIATGIAVAVFVPVVSYLINKFL